MELASTEKSGQSSRMKWSDAHLPIRIAATQEAIKRARFAFFLCVLASSASFVCLWNTHISWYRGFGFKEMPGYNETDQSKKMREMSCDQVRIFLQDNPSPLKWTKEQEAEEQKLGADCEASGIAQTRAYLVQDQVRAWVESQSITINLLGIRIAVSDFAILNSLALYAFVYYYLLSARRENREIGQLLREVRDNLDSTGYTVYASIASYMVFTLNKGDDNPIASLEPDKDKEPTKFGILRSVVRVLFLLPLFVVLFTIL